MVEIMVMSGVGLVLLGIFYSFFIQSTSDSKSMGQKLQAIQGAHLLLEHLENDVKQAFYLKNVYDVQVFDWQGGVANGLSFHRVDSSEPPPSKGGQLKLERVEYVFDPRAARVMVNGRPFASGMFKRVEFSFTPGAPMADPPKYADYLTVTVTGVPDELASRDISVIDVRSLATLVSTFSFRNRAIKEANPSWTLQRGLLGQY